MKHPRGIPTWPNWRKANHGIRVKHVRTGQFGIVVRILNQGIRVKWDNGGTSLIISPAFDLQEAREAGRKGRTMNTTREDDRTAEERVTHHWGVVAKDKFMSGWGGATGGASRAAWACRSDDVDRVLRWVRNRPEMRYVNVVDLRTYRAPRGTAHFHIYVVDDNHPART